VVNPPQQAPGFCEQKFSNWSASEPGAGVASAVGESAWSGAAAPPPAPLSVVPVSVPPVAAPESAVSLPVEPLWVSGTVPLASGVAVAVGVAVASAFAPLPELEPESSELVSFGIGTLAGGPGTSW
jgi:hypothetical protein